MPNTKKPNPFGASDRFAPRHPERGTDLTPEQQLRLYTAELHAVDMYLDSFPDYAVGLRRAMTEARRRILDLIENSGKGTVKGIDK